MQALFQSSFLQSLGFAIANSLWQTAIVWLLYLLVSHIFSVSSAAKYRMAVAAQLLGFIWFVFTLQFYYSQYNEALRNSATLVPGPQNIQAVMAGDHGFISQVIRAMVKIEQMLPYISMAYLMLILFLAIRWISSYRQTQLMRTQGLQKIPVEWRLFVINTAAQLGIKKDIRLFLSENITTPLTIGFLKPLILIPVASINHLTTEQLEAVLLHELAHIKRFDYLANIILSIAELTLFFNPFTQLLSKSIRKERENACDDWVLRFRYNAADYVEALLRIACLQQQSPAFAMAASGKKNELLVRVKRMIGQKENTFNYRRQLLALVMVTGMLGCMAWLDPVVSKSNDNRQPSTIKQTTLLVQPSHQRVAIGPMAIKFKNEKQDKEFAKMKQVLKKMNKLTADSFNFLPGFIPVMSGHEFAKSLKMAKEDIEKAGKEFLNHKKIKKSAQFDTEKIKIEVNNVMKQFSAAHLDKWMEENPIPAIRISNKEIVVGGLTFSDDFFKELQVLANIIKTIPIETLSPKSQKDLRLKVERFMKLRMGNKKIATTDCDEEEESGFKAQMQ